MERSENEVSLKLPKKKKEEVKQLEVERTIQFSGCSQLGDMFAETHHKFIERVTDVINELDYGEIISVSYIDQSAPGCPSETAIITYK